MALKLTGVRRNFDLDDETVRALFTGLSHADIERVLRRAVKGMVLTGNEFLEVRHIDAARERETER